MIDINQPAIRLRMDTNFFRTDTDFFRTNTDFFQTDIGKLLIDEYADTKSIVQLSRTCTNYYLQLKDIVKQVKRIYKRKNVGDVFRHISKYRWACNYLLRCETNVTNDVISDMKKHCIFNQIILQKEMGLAEKYVRYTDVQNVSKIAYAALNFAIESDDIRVFMYVWGLVNQSLTDGKYQSMLEEACRSGSLAMLTYIVELVLKNNKRSILHTNNYSPIRILCKRENSIELFQYFLSVSDSMLFESLKINKIADLNISRYFLQQYLDGIPVCRPTVTTCALNIWYGDNIDNIELYQIADILNQIKLSDKISIRNMEQLSYVKSHRNIIYYCMIDIYFFKTLCNNIHLYDEVDYVFSLFNNVMSLHKDIFYWDGALCLSQKIMSNIEYIIRNRYYHIIRGILALVPRNRYYRVVDSALVPENEIEIEIPLSIRQDLLCAIANTDCPYSFIGMTDTLPDSFFTADLLNSLCAAFEVACRGTDHFKCRNIFNRIQSLAITYAIYPQISDQTLLDCIRSNNIETVKLLLTKNQTRNWIGTYIDYVPIVRMINYFEYFNIWKSYNKDILNQAYQLALDNGKNDIADLIKSYV